MLIITMQAYIDHIEMSLRNADKYQSKCSKDILALDGMSGKKTRHFYNNICSLPGTRYLEIGSWRGSTLCSAMYGNKIQAIAIDNWSYNSEDRTGFFSNFHRYVGQNSVKVFEQDCWTVSQSDLGMKFNIYMYDGDHSQESHERALTHFHSSMDDVFILIVDDWNWNYVRNGTFSGIQKSNLKICYQREIFTGDENVHPEFAGPKSDWHNGIAFFVLAKQ